MAIYNHISLAVARQQLANRLYDSAQTFWAAAELTSYIQEALRTWNALTGYWRSEFIFPANGASNWYDLTDASALPNTLRKLTLTDRDLYSVMQYHLLEPVAWNPWTGVSQQFTDNDLLNAVQRKRDELLSICGHTITRRTTGAVAGRIRLPDTVLDVRRVAYLPAGGGYGSGNYGAGSYGISLPKASVMWPEDAWSEQAFGRNYTLNPAGTPSAYLLSAQPPISFDTDIPPGFAGQYEILSVDAGPALSVPIATTLATPDDWAWVIKWGALADLLSRESNSRDPLRADYCEQRYRLGAHLLATASSLLTIRVNDVPLQIDSVRSADLYRTSWQSLVDVLPDMVLTAGLNLIAFAPLPYGTGAMTATVVQNAPVPVGDADPVQVSRDDLDAVIDYAQHLAAFKQGGAEFISTMPLLKRFFEQAALYGLKLAELGEFTSSLYGLAQREESANPRLSADPSEVGA